MKDNAQFIEAQSDELSVDSLGAALMFEQLSKETQIKIIEMLRSITANR